MYDTGLTAGHTETLDSHLTRLTPKQEAEIEDMIDFNQQDV